MDHLLAKEKLGDDPCQASGKRVGGSLAEETLLHQACLFVKDRLNCLAVTILDGQRNQVGGPIGIGLPPADHGLHSNRNSAALERLHQIVQVVDFSFRKNHEQVLSAFHHVDGEAFRDVVMSTTFNRERAEPLQPPAGKPSTFVESLAIHHKEKSAAAAPR